MSNSCEMIHCREKRRAAELRNKTRSEVENNISDILNLLEAEKNVKYSRMKNVILIMGNLGTEKNVFTQFIAKNSESPEIRKISENSMITDSILPTLIKDTEHNLTFIDCPAFSDDAVYNITGTYFIKNIIDSSDSLKLIFTINYSSVRSNEEDADFMLLLDHAVELVRNLEKFKDSMALVVTNVTEVSDTGFVINDESIIERIANVLKNWKENIESKKSLSPNDAVVQFLDTFLITDEVGHFARIGIFRKPDESERLTSMIRSWNNKNLLKRILHENLKFSSHDESDFGYTLHSDSRNYIPNLIEKINENIALHIKYVGQEIEEYYYNQEKQCSNISDLNMKLVEGYYVFAATKAAGMQCTRTQCLTSRINQNVINLGINILNEDLSSVDYYGKLLKFIKSVSNESNVIKPEQWCEGLANMIAYLYDSKNWYKFLKFIENGLSMYDVQKYVHANPTSDLARLKFFYHEDEKEGIQESNINKVANVLEKVLKDYIVGKYESAGPFFTDVFEVKTVKLNQPKTEFLNSILDATLRVNVSISCDANKGVIKGKYVMLSSVYNNDCMSSKSIEIFALDTIYIDTNIELTGDEVQLSIIAPRWEVITLQTIYSYKRNAEGIVERIPLQERADYRFIRLNGDKITIDSDNSSQSSEDTSISEKSVNGRAGNFIGISQSFINGEFLQIIADGGKGKISYDDYIDIEPLDSWRCKYRAMHEMQSMTITDSWFNKSCKIAFENRLYSKGRCILSPENCDNSTYFDGNILLFVLEEQPNIKMSDGQGEIGNSGNGCRGQSEDMNKSCAEIGFTRIPFRNSPSSEPFYQYFFNYGYTTDIHKINSNSTIASHLPTLANHYKSYARENLISDISNPLLRTFLNEIDKYDFYTTLDFVNELHGLEEQFHDLRKDVSLLPFYQPLLDRVQRYAEKHEKSGELKSDEKKILNYICTAILSKINSINNELINDFSRNLPKYFTEAIDDINEIQHHHDISLKYSYYEHYQKQIKDRIDEATKIIETEITPELRSMFPEIEKKIESMIAETLDKIEKIKEEREANIKNKEKLEQILKLRYVYGFAKIFFLCFGYLGPLGAAIGAVATSGTMVMESLRLDDQSSLGIDKLTTLPAAVKISFARITEEYKKKETFYKIKLYDAEQEMKKYSDKEPSMKDVHDKIEDTRVKYEHEEKNGIPLDQESMDRREKYKKELAELFEKKKTLLEAEKAKSGAKVDKKLNMLTHVQAVVGIAEVGVDIYSKIKNNQGKIKNVNDAIVQADAEIKALEIFEKEICRTIIPIGKKIAEAANNTLSNLAGLSKAALMLSGWRINNVLRDYDIQLDELTEDYSVHGGLNYCMQKLQYGMSIVVDMYSRIQSYEKEKQLADFIANIQLGKSKEITINDTNLNSALKQLRFNIQSNLILDKYENSVKAFKHHVFPLADYYLMHVDLPPIHRPNELNDSVANIVETIRDLKTKIEKFDDGRNKYLSEKHKDVKFGCNSYWAPFFVWKYNEYKRDIHKLLEGKEVLLKSDVRHGINKNAIKFNEIGIRFRLANNAKQDDLDSLLENFEVTMKHLGTSYYRCDDKFYKITTKDTDLISYVFKKNCSEKPDLPNGIYDDIAKYAPLLSPYAMWSIQLTEDINGGNFDVLSKYKNEEIDLELQGKGEYMDLNLDVCQSNLDKYYVQDDIMSEVNFVSISKRAKLFEQKYSIRRRRSIQDNYLIQGIDRSSIATNSGCSNVKSSFINKFFNVIGSSLMILKYWMPENDASPWFVNYNDNVNNEKQHFNHHNEMKPWNIQSWQKELPTGPANDESPNVEKITNSYSFCTNSNLFLLDSLIRWKNGTKHKQGHCMMRNDFGVKHAQDLAYAAYAHGDN